MQSEQQDSILQGHLPECHAYQSELPLGFACICPALRACEQRVREEWYEVQSETWVRGFDVGVRAAREERMKEDDDYAYVAAQAEAQGRRRGWNDALDAVEAAVAEQKIVPLAKQRRFIITRNTKLWNDRQSWAEYGWWSHRTSSLAAIDALRATDRPPTSPAKAKSADLYDPQWGEMIH